MEHGITSVRRTRWTGDQLVHPNQETVASDHADRQHWPDQDSQRDEREQLLSTGDFSKLTMCSGRHSNLPHRSGATHDPMRLAIAGVSASNGKITKSGGAESH